MYVSYLATMSLIATLVSLPVVAIDAGHGGEQHGAFGVCRAVEKDITLAIAKHLAGLLEKSGQVRPYLIRTGDKHIELKERAEKANMQQARIFLSIHANASVNQQAHGFETFFLSNKTDVAHADVPDTLQYILTGLTLDATHHESQRFAMQLQRELHMHLKSHGRGVLQAPFAVLVGARMAAALVEVGFLTNPNECKQLTRASHQQTIAKALAAAILKHLASASALIAQD